MNNEILIERPKSNADCVKAVAASMALPGVREWIEQGGVAGYDTTDEALTAQLVDMFKWHSHDGYECARHLEETFDWMPDANLVETLDGMFLILAHEQCVAKWAFDNNITAKLSVGTIVPISERPYQQAQVKVVSGEITGIDVKNARYLICSAELGHVKEGQGYHGIYKDFEEIEAQNPDLCQ